MQLKTIFWKEGKWYIIKDTITGVATQGKTMEEATKNLKDAVSLYLEKVPSARKGSHDVKRTDDYLEFVLKAQQVKMKELWDNKEDETW